MRKTLAILTLVTVCLAMAPTSAFGQNRDLPAAAIEHRAEASYPTHRDTTSRPLREMFDTGAPAKPARGGRDFEPGRPDSAGNTNPKGIDPLAERSVGSPSTFADPKASTVGTPIDPNARVAPPDTTGDVGPKSLCAMGQPALLDLHIDPRARATKSPALTSCRVSQSKET